MVIDDKVIDDQVIDNKVIDDKVIDDQVIDNQVIDNKVKVKVSWVGSRCSQLYWYYSLFLFRHSGIVLSEKAKLAACRLNSEAYLRI